MGVKRLELEADHSLPSSAEAKNAWSYTSSPHTPSWRGAYFEVLRIKGEGNFVPVLNNAMKTHRWIGSIAPHILKLGTSWR
jgi:hypothetical protein